MSLLTISTPGRICLFGEHQDYLGLPVMAAAISRRIQITAQQTPERGFTLYLPDIGSRISIPFADKELPYLTDRDYFRSAINVLLREGFTFSNGIAGEVRGNIPINSGTSSSSALIVTWLNVLTQLADEPRTLPAEKLAELAEIAEVREFGEPGGMMDHYATAVGGVIYLESQPKIYLEALTPPLGAFVLGDSQEPKDTIGILSRVKFGMLDILKRIRSANPAFSLHTAQPTEVLEPECRPVSDLLTKDEYVLLKGTVSNRDLLRQARTLVQAPDFDHYTFGKLLTAHHETLRDAQRISTPKIDRMLDAALSAGALGGKINGSGGGGCMFAYAPDLDSPGGNAQAVAEAIERAGGRAYIVAVDEGTRCC